MLTPRCAQHPLHSKRDRQGQPSALTRQQCGMLMQLLAIHIRFTSHCYAIATRSRPHPLGWFGRFGLRLP